LAGFEVTPEDAIAAAGSSFAEVLRDSYSGRTPRWRTLINRRSPVYSCAGEFSSNFEPMADASNPITPNAQDAEPESYAFVMNVGSLSDATAYTLAPGHELRRASADEIAFIKSTVDRFGPNPFVSHNGLVWEERLPRVQGRPIQRSPENEWRYFVIAFRGTNETLVELSLVFELSTELEVGFTRLFIDLGGTSITWNPDRLFRWLQEFQALPVMFTNVSSADVKEIRVLHSQLRNHDRTVLDVRNLAGQLGQVKALPHLSPLRFLAYFAILESLLTHAPKQSDPYDSITRQINAKLSLLNHRFPKAIDYRAFGDAPPATVWARMYAYRSRLAHGGTARFDGDLQILASHDAALALIKETVKAVIRQALLEPRLLLDLREC
jgi:hypothetical protein